MAESEATNQAEQQQANGAGNGSGDGARKTALRAAALAAATGATALAARKMMSDRGDSSSGGTERAGGGGSTSGDSVVGTMLSTGWNAAKDTLLPVAEDAAASAGEYVARSGPDVVRERLVPRFIAGFQGAQQSDD